MAVEIEMDTSKALVTRASTRDNTAPSFLQQATIVDDSPLWLAWDAAQTAWLESKRRKSGRDNTVRAYRLATGQFFEWAGVEPWRVSPVHAQNWAMHLTELGRSRATVGLKLAALSSFYDFVQRRYSFTTPDGRSMALWPADRANPFGTVERPKVSAYGRAKYPTTDELKAILAEINTGCLTGKRDFALLYAISTTCRRSSEILNLRWGDLRTLEEGDLAFSYIYKGGEERTSVLNRMAWQAIEAYLRADGRPPEKMTDDQYLFIPLDPERILRLNPEADVNPNRPISNHQANAILKKYGARAGVELERCHIHGLRHAGARLRVEQMKTNGRGVDYMELMQLLGHSSLAVTQIYSQVVLEDPEDPGGEAAARALLPKNRRRKPAKPKQEALPL